MSTRDERIKLAIDPEQHSKELTAFRDWYINAKAGQWFTYYYGLTLHDNYGAEAVRMEAWDFACEGKIYLFQRRCSQNPRMCEYLCQKASKRMPHLNPKKIIKADKDTSKCRMN